MRQTLTCRSCKERLDNFTFEVTTETKQFWAESIERALADTSHLPGEIVELLTAAAIILREDAPPRDGLFGGVSVRNFVRAFPPTTEQLVDVDLGRAWNYTIPDDNDFNLDDEQVRAVSDSLRQTIEQGMLRTVWGPAVVERRWAEISSGLDEVGEVAFIRD